MEPMRVLVRQREALFRLLRIEMLADGSVVILIDRNSSVVVGAMKSTDLSGAMDNPDANGRVAQHGKISCHTTGQINRYSAGRFSSMHYVEPLYALSKPSLLAFYSVPQLGRLDAYDTSKHAGLGAVLDLGDIGDRVTFVIGIGPRGTSLANYGLTIDYELYSVLIEPTTIPNFPEFPDRFVEASPKSGTVDERQIDMANAELNFYNRVHGTGPKVFREKGGSYVALTSVPMRITPNMVVSFSRKDLSAELITSTSEHPITHKAKFWIRDKGGVNRRDDLREFITSIQFSASL